ncbi:MAG: hypothetical protein JNL74_07630 [Fibrobacteres bacterium]|nr:hypothetical protein [Fibrobacterota bacterium]
MRFFYPVVFFMLVCSIACFSAAPTVNNPMYKQLKNKKFIKEKITYIPLIEGMKHPASAWGSIGYTREGYVYVAVCDHASTSMIYEYDTKKDKLFTLGDVKSNFHLNSWQERQPKIHTPLIQHDKDRLVYFGTDAGDRSLDLGDHRTEGYFGGYLGTIDPVTKEVKTFGRQKAYAGYKSLLLDSKRNVIYSTMPPSAYFVKYDISKNLFTDLGRINSIDVPRTLFFDKWDNVYTSDSWGNLVRYIPDKDTIEVLNIKLFGNDAVGASQVAYTKDRENVYGVLGSGALIKYTPAKDGQGKLDTLSGMFKGKGLYIRNLNYAEGKLFVVVKERDKGEAGVDAPEVKTYLYVVNFEKRLVEKKILMDPRVEACFGAHVRDSEGNIYVVSHADGIDLKPYGDNPDNILLIKFNPKDF